MDSVISVPSMLSSSSTTTLPLVRPFFLFLDVDEGGAWGRMAAASLRGLPRGRLSAWAGLPVDVAPTLLEGGEGPWSEGSTVLSSDDILPAL